MDTLELWQRYEAWLYYHDGLELYVDISCMRFDEVLAESLEPGFANAFADMTALERGAIANPDENRMVGHYWLRDPNLAPENLRSEITRTLEQLEDFAQKVHAGAIKPAEADKFTDILSIGIGGSALGPQFVAEALAPDHPPMASHFIDNTDPAGMDRVLNRLGDRLKSTLTVTIQAVTLPTVGALIALYERAVGFASLVNINACHQPGVEASKKAAACILELQKQIWRVMVSSGGQPMPLTTLAAEVEAPEQIQSIYKILRHFAANQRGISLQGDPAKPSFLKVAVHSAA